MRNSHHHRYYSPSTLATEHSLSGLLTLIVSPTSLIILFTRFHTRTVADLFFFFFLHCTNEVAADIFYFLPFLALFTLPIKFTLFKSFVQPRSTILPHDRFFFQNGGLHGHSARFRKLQWLVHCLQTTCPLWPLLLIFLDFPFTYKIDLF